MTYAYDNWILLPTRDLYDTQVMAMAINAAKDMYDRGELRIKDFNTTYGDFMSPFAKDMERYGQMVGNVRDTINNLYANGIDPLRSAEGRAIVSRLVNSINPAEFSRMKANAKMGYAYLDDIEKAKARREFNEDYENFLLNQPGGPGAFKDFSSANGAMWTRSAAGRYADLNQYTSHIFDALKDSFIRNDGAYDYYGVTEGDLAKSLTPDTLGGLLNTDLGRFHYQNAIKDLAMQGNLNPTRAELMEQFRKNVIAANHEKVHEDRRINEMWKLRQEHSSRIAAARIAASVNDTNDAPTPVGVNTALTMDSANKYLKNRNLSISNYFNSAGGIKATQQFEKLTDKLNSRDKEIAQKYMAAKDVIDGNNSTAQERQEAKEYIRKVSNKKDPNFVAWRKQYDKISRESVSQWNRENTLEGIIGNSGSVKASDIYAASKHIFNNNYAVSRDSEQRSLLDKHLPYREGENGNYAFMNKDTYFQPKALLEIVQGNNQRRRYRDYMVDLNGQTIGTRTLVKTISDLIRGKKYYEADAIDRTYGSGMLHGSTKNIINERVVFKNVDNDKLNEYLKSLDEDELKMFDIEKTSDETGWLIPITHSQDIDLSYANIDSYSDKDVSGSSEAGKRQVIRQGLVLSR